MNDDQKIAYHIYEKKTTNLYYMKPITNITNITNITLNLISSHKLSDIFNAHIGLQCFRNSYPTIIFLIIFHNSCNRPSNSQAAAI